MSRRKAGLSYIKSYDYFHLSCIKPEIPLNTARMLPSLRCSDCLFGTVTSLDEPSITGATSYEAVLDPIGDVNSVVYTRQTNRAILRISKSFRIQAANVLSDTIKNILSLQIPPSWTKIFFFAIEMFSISTQTGNDHRTFKTAQQIHDILRRHLLTSSTDILCDITPDVLESLLSKHPPAQSNIEIMPIPKDIPSMTTFSQSIR